MPSFLYSIEKIQFSVSSSSMQSLFEYCKGSVSRGMRMISSRYKAEEEWEEEEWEEEEEGPEEEEW